MTGRRQARRRTRHPAVEAARHSRSRTILQALASCVPGAAHDGHRPATQLSGRERLGCALALHEDAVWFVPSPAVEDDLAGGLFVRLSLPFGGTDEPIGMIRRNDEMPSPAVVGLVEGIRPTGQQREQARIKMAIRRK